MAIGVFYGLLAGALWGLVFLVPRLLPAFTPWELAAGRYLVYGAVGLAALAPRLRSVAGRLGPHDRRTLLRHALAGNLVYYVLLAYGVQLAGVAPTSLIIGLLPVAVTLMGRRDRGAPALRRLAAPLLLVAAGVGCIGADLFGQAAAAETAATAPAARAIGLLCAVCALGCWSWYSLDNARYLQRHAHFSSSEWSALYGVTSGVLAAGLALAGYALFGDRITGAAGAASGRDWPLFWLLNSVLALGASLVGNQLWNAASRLVPVTLGGQLIVFETLFALLYGFVHDGRGPRVLEAAAIALLLAGVLWAVRRHAVAQPHAGGVPARPAE